MERNLCEDVKGLGPEQEQALPKKSGKSNSDTMVVKKTERLSVDAEMLPKEIPFSVKERVAFPGKRGSEEGHRVLKSLMERRKEGSEEETQTCQGASIIQRL